MQEELYEELRQAEDSHWWFRGRRAVIWSLLRRAPITWPAKVLDAGCGTGRNMVEFASLGEIHGIDPSAEAIKLCRARGLENVAAADLTELPFEDESFGAILALDVFEHVEDDRLAAEETRRVARPDSALVLTVPAGKGLWSQHDESHGHFRRYERDEIESVVTHAGWRPVTVTHFNSLLLPPIAVARRFRRNGGPTRSDYALTPGWMNSLLELPMRAEASLVSRGVSLPAGVSIGMVCVPER